MQNHRWLAAQAGISPATRRELKRYFSLSNKNQQDSTTTTTTTTAPPPPSLLSAESQTLLQRLQAERTAALSGQNDWFKQPFRRRPAATKKADPGMDDLARLMGKTGFSDFSSRERRRARRKRRKRLRERLSGGLERLGRGQEEGGGEEAAGAGRRGVGWGRDEEGAADDDGRGR